MKRVIFIVLAFVVLQACTKDNSHLREGLLSFGIAGGEGVMVQTRAGDDDVLRSKATAALPCGDYSNFIVNAGSAGVGNDLIGGAVFSDVENEKFIVKEGRYEASAYNITEQEAHPAAGFGSVRYYGVKYFDVTAGELTSVTIPCAITNSIVSVVVDENFLKAFDYNETTITVSTDALGSERPLSFTAENGHLLKSGDAAATTPDAAKSAFYPAETYLYFTIRARLNSLGGNGAVKTYSCKGDLSADGATVKTTAATWHKIVISADLSNAPQGITIKVGQKQETISNGISINGYNGGSLTEDQ